MNNEALPQHARATRSITLGVAHGQCGSAWAFAADPIKIGQVAALRGASAQSGEAIPGELTLAIDEINAKEGLLEPTEGIQPSIVKEIEEVSLRLNPRSFSLWLSLNRTWPMRAASPSWRREVSSRRATSGDLSDDLVHRHMAV